ncbi:MAG: pitrilysin family protein [Candidatus Uhrbacteria bacterium]|nr:insulinase family protein [Patescibacteria group bacterium]MBU1906990.1 insulinase family protein [Patescibacteria group bacterium]
MYKKQTLKNGTRVHLIPVAGTDTATALVLVKVGSRYEPPELSGASHFIEHLLFKGTKKRPSTLEISRALDSVGAEFNAYTGKDRTGYYIKAASEHLPLAIDMLYDMLFHSKFAPAEVKRERGVIIEEINMYHDNPMMYAEDLLEQAMFEGSTLGAEIAGTRQTMTEMPRAGVLAYHREHYVPENIVVSLAGKISETQAVKLVKNTFGKVPDGNRQPSIFAPFGETPKRNKPRVKIQYKDTKQTQIALGFPSYGKNNQRVPAAKLLGSILGGTMSSRLFLSIRERKGLAYFIRASQSEYEDVGMFTIQSGLDLSRLNLAAQIMVRELNSIKKHGVTTEELRRAKDNLHGRVTIALEDSMHQAEFYAEQDLFFNEIKSPKERLTEFDKVTRAEVQQVANEIIDFKRLSIAGIGPYKTPASLLKHFSL